MDHTAADLTCPCPMLRSSFLGWWHCRRKRRRPHPGKAGRAGEASRALGKLSSLLSKGCCPRLRRAAALQKLDRDSDHWSNFTSSVHKAGGLQTGRTMQDQNYAVLNPLPDRKRVSATWCRSSLTPRCHRKVVPM